MDRIWKSGLMAGAIGDTFIVLSLVVLGNIFTIFKEQNALFALLVLLSSLLAFAVAGLSSGILVSPYARNDMESFKSGLVSGAIVASLLVLFIASMIVLDPRFIMVGPPAGAWSVALGISVMAIVLLSLVALAGMISMVYTSYGRLKGRESAETHAGDEELGDLKALYDDLWKDARTLVADMNRSIQMYLFAGLLMLVLGLITLCYAAVSLQRIYSGSPTPADYAAAIGETFGGLLMVIVGPLLIRWYYRLKSRYAHLASIEKGDV